jgi:hypothetical protein
MKTDDIELIESFERVENIEEIILLGEKGGIRRIQILSPKDKINNCVKRLRRLK